MCHHWACSNASAQAVSFHQESSSLGPDSDFLSESSEAVLKR
uniref:Uncharacterized protein n=1 Tax=Arundo donax TaxID=35708 RepID=A0A0A9HCR4_ARUDO